jgi:biotin carboxyl carrier protein
VAEQVRAEMVANVLTVLVSAGDEVSAGDAVVILESMKMEIPVLVERPGRVWAIDVRAGDVVQEGDILVQLLGPGDSEPALG